LQLGFVERYRAAQVSPRCLSHSPTARRSGTTLSPSAFAVYGRRCADCSRSDLPLEVHHVNSDKTDNRITNLVPLCRDCHRLATFPGHLT
jgi:5-methylcytosine-specific restriction endonuclease McrA